MKIKFTRTVAASHKLYHDGDEADIYEAHAKVYIQRGHAIEVKEEKEEKETKEHKPKRKTK